VLPGPHYRLRAVTAVMGILWREYALRGNGRRSTRCRELRWRVGRAEVDEDFVRCGAISWRGHGGDGNHEGVRERSRDGEIASSASV
jgi:hypothetical protein